MLNAYGTFKLLFLFDLVISYMSVLYGGSSKFTAIGKEFY